MLRRAEASLSQGAPLRWIRMKRSWLQSQAECTNLNVEVVHILHTPCRWIKSARIILTLSLPLTSVGLNR
jgi:hypothetical protein